MVDDTDDDDPITITHLIGEWCVFNKSILVYLAKGGRGHIELFLEEGDRYAPLRVDRVLSMCSDGGFILTLVTPDGHSTRQRAEIILAKLFKPEASKGAGT